MNGKGIAMTTAKAFEPCVTAILNTANKEAIKAKRPYVEPDLILLGILLNDSTIACKALAKLVDLATLTARVKKYTENQTSMSSIPDAIKLPLSISSQYIMEEAKTISGNDPVRSDHLLQAISKSSNTAASIFLSYYGISPKKVDDAIIQVNKEISEEKAMRAASITDTVKKASGAVSSALFAASSVVDAVSSSLKDAMRMKPHKAVTRNDWIEILDTAMALSYEKDISVPAAFTEVCMNSKLLFEKSSIRRETLQELVQQLLDKDSLST